MKNTPAKIAPVADGPRLAIVVEPGRPARAFLETGALETEVELLDLLLDGEVTGEILIAFRAAVELLADRVGATPKPDLALVVNLADRRASR